MRQIFETWKSYLRTNAEFFPETKSIAKVDVLGMNQLKDNLELTEEILKNGVKIYG